MNIKNKYQILAPLFLCLTLIIVSPTLSYGQGQLSLLFTDKDNIELPGLSVEICGPNLDRIQTCLTDELGRCHFTNLPAGSYRIKGKLPGFKTRILKNIKIQSTAVTLKIMLELDVIIERRPVGRGTPPPVDPTITSFTDQDAIALSEASTSLHEIIAPTWDKMSMATNVCDKREILIKDSRIWRSILSTTERKLTTSPQAQEKRFMISAVFDGIERHIRIDKDSISEFDQNVLKLKTALCTIANFLKFVSDTGKATFDLRIMSYPKDAKLTYGYVYGGPMREHKERTPTTLKNLYYAPIELNISVEGYYTEKILYDPFKDDSKKIDVNLQKKEK